MAAFVIGDSAFALSLALSCDGVGVGHLSQCQDLISREVVHRRHGQHTMKFLVGGNIIQFAASRMDLTTAQKADTTGWHPNSLPDSGYTNQPRSAARVPELCLAILVNLQGCAASFRHPPGDSNRSHVARASRRQCHWSDRELHLARDTSILGCWDWRWRSRAMYEV